MKQLNTIRVALIGLSGHVPEDVETQLSAVYRDVLHFETLSTLRSMATLRDDPIVVVLRSAALTGNTELSTLQRWAHALRAIVLVERGDVDAAVAATKSGAADALEWPGHGNELVRRIETVASELCDAALQRRPATVLDRLSSRERGVLDLLVQGHSNKLIGQQLGISERTVEVHRANIMRKLHVSSFAALVRLAIAAGTP